MRINGVDAVVLGVEDLDAGRKFYEDFGLRRDGGGEFLTSDDTGISLRKANDGGLPAAVADGPTIREVVWGLSSQEEVDAVAAELARDRDVRVDADRTVHSVDDEGFGIAFRTTRRKEVAPAPNLLNIYGATPNRPVNSRMNFLEAVRPAAIAHVVLMTPNVERSVRFYTERLGFRVTDRFAGWKGAFLRSAGSPYHHNLFLISSPTRGLHHIAFAVTDFNEVVLGGQAMMEHGWDSKMGPGRHVIGSNYFWYFNSPCGGAMELTADMDRADDDWQTGEWDYMPQNTMAWSMDFKLLPGQGKNHPRTLNNPT